MENLKNVWNRLVGLLGARAWAGVAVFVGIVGIVVAVLIGTAEPPIPENALVRDLQHLQEMDENVDSSNLTVDPGDIYTTLRAVENFRQVTIGDGAVLEIGEREAWTLNALSLDIGERVRIVASGDQGTDGDDGTHGTNGGRCRNGTDGEPGESGEIGRPGKDLLIQAIELHLPTTSVRVDTTGGQGGNGGMGGNGGSGGRGSRTDSCGGGDGGSGGNGGNAGDGGSGGNLVLRYLSATTTVDEESAELDPSTVMRLVEHDASGGNPGELGTSGTGGAGGPGRGASIFTFDAQPAGSMGSNGADGSRGAIGASGSTDVSRVSTPSL